MSVLRVIMTSGQNKTVQRHLCLLSCSPALQGEREGERAKGPRLRTPVRTSSRYYLYVLLQTAHPYFPFHILHLLNSHPILPSCLHTVSLLVQNIVGLFIETISSPTTWRLIINYECSNLA